MIDKKGKLFGLVNFFDLFVLFTILIISIFIVKKLSKSDKPVLSNDINFSIQIYGDHIADYVADIIKIGDTVYDEEKNILLGTITKIEVGDGFQYTPDKDGVLHKASKEGYKSMLITTKIKAQPFENGFIVNNNKYNVGYILTCITGKGKIFARISAIEV